MARTRKEQKAAEDVTCSIVNYLASLKHADELISTHMAIAKDRELQDSLPDDVVRTVDFPKE